MIVFVSTLGQNLKRLRRSKGLSQQRLYELSRVSVQYIQHIEQGVAGKRISAEKLAALARALGVSPDDLRGEGVAERVPTAVVEQLQREIALIWDRLDDDARQQLVHFGEFLAGRAERESNH